MGIKFFGLLLGVHKLHSYERQIGKLIYANDNLLFTICCCIVIDKYDTCILSYNNIWYYKNKKHNL